MASNIRCESQWTINVLTGQVILYMSGYANLPGTAIKGAARFLEYTNSSNAQSHFQ